MTILTVRIIYQNIESNKTEESAMFEEPNMPKAQITNNENTSPHKERRRRRSIEKIPYHKNPRILQLTVDDMETRNYSLTNSQLYTEIDNIWMISHALESTDVPMWVGFGFITIIAINNLFLI